MEMEEVKGLIEEQGKAFEEFKQTLDGMKKHDAVNDEKLQRIEKDLDKAAEQKTAIEAAIEAERKEREDLELRLAKRGKRIEDGRDMDAEAKTLAHAIGVKTDDMDAEKFGHYESGIRTYFRKGYEVVNLDEAKAMSVGGDPQGGYFVTPDMSGRIVRKVFETSPVRQVANVTTIATDALEGMEDLEESASGWVGETGSRSDTGTPNVGRYKIEVFEVYAQPKVTQKLLDDASVDVEAWIADKVASEIGRRENEAFVTGDGSLKPRGLTAYTTSADTGSGVDWGRIGHVISGKNGAFADTNPSDKLIDLVGTLKNAYTNNARWMAKRELITQMRKFKDGSGQYYLWQPALTAGQPETLLGYPIVRAEDMPALATGSISLLFGDFGAAYQIVDRLGIRVLRDPYTQKPYVKFYTTKRVGGGVTNFEAMKAMKFSAS